MIVSHSVKRPYTAFRIFRPSLRPDGATFSNPCATRAPTIRGSFASSCPGFGTRSQHSGEFVSKKYNMFIRNHTNDVSRQHPMQVPLDRTFHKGALHVHTSNFSFSNVFDAMTPSRGCMVHHKKRRDHRTNREGGLPGHCNPTIRRSSSAATLQCAGRAT